jgi:hypothetical protein
MLKGFAVIWSPFNFDMGLLGRDRSDMASEPANSRFRAVRSVRHLRPD